MTNTRSPSELTLLRDLLRTFSSDRDWEKFHTPKNLSIALNVEAAELLELFQWLPTGSSADLGPKKLAAARLEMADVLAYLIMLADKLDINLAEALHEKIELNGQKYPAQKVFGRADKYTEYED